MHVGSPRLSSFRSTRPADYQFGFRSQCAGGCGWVCMCVFRESVSGAQFLVTGSSLAVSRARGLIFDIILDSLGQILFPCYFSALIAKH